MARQLFSNNASTTLSSSITSTDTTLNVNSTAAFPSIAAGSGDWFVVALENTSGDLEFVKIIGVPDAVTLTVDPAGRGFEGSSARSWNAGDRVELRVTAGSLDRLAQADPPAASGNVAELDGNGNLQDSGVKLSDKADKTTPSAAGNVAELDASGNLQDSGIQLSAKADKIVPTAGGNLAELNASGNLQDSGTSVTQIHAVMPSAHGVLAPHKNLRITRPTTSTVSITADEVVLTDASTGLKVLASSVSVTGDITAAAGPNGPDVTPISTGWYYIWLIYNGSTVASLLSQSSTAPTLPSGYTHKGLVGAFYEDATTGVLNFKQINNRSFYVTHPILYDSGSSGVGDTSWHVLDTARGAPPNASLIRFTILVYEHSGSTNTYVYLSYDAANTASLVGGSTHGVSYGNFENIAMLNTDIYFSVPVSTNEVQIRGQGWEF